VEPAAAVAAAANGKPVVFLDDFVGSGDQFCSTWGRPYMQPTGARQSFADVFSQAPFTAVYLCLLTTQTGYDRIRAEVPSLLLESAHILPNEDSVRAVPTSPLVPPLAEPQKAVANLLQRHAARLTLPAYMTQHDFAQYGYQSLGTMIGFEHSIPDATIPIIWAGGPTGWMPLAKRL
jgi:hypothetical protein